MRNNNKVSLVFWSGGFDSTYICLRHLLRDEHFDVVYVNILNNDDKTIMEKESLQTLLQDFEKIKKKIRKGKKENKLIDKRMRFLTDNKINVESHDGICKGQVPIWFAFSLYCMYDYYDKIEIGVIKEDKWGEAAERFKKAYEQFIELDNIFAPERSRDKYAQISFPVVNKTKKQIIQFIKDVDSKYKTKILKHIKTCEYPIMKTNEEGERIFVKECGECKKCEEKEKAIK